MIKEFYMQEIGSAPREIEKERQRRREAEKMVERLGEEVKRLQAHVEKREVKVVTLEKECKKLQESEMQN